MIRRKKKRNGDITTIYSDAQEFVTSQEHCVTRMSLQDSPNPQKPSSKFFLWLLENEFKKEAEVTVAREEAKPNKECGFNLLKYHLQLYLKDGMYM